MADSSCAELRRLPVTIAPPRVRITFLRTTTWRPPAPALLPPMPALVDYEGVAKRQAARRADADLAAPWIDLGGEGG